ncbi:MAG: NAD(P)/FAD-dependent oxidoreductase [Clostridia bacterium]|nr:NAD(P)/FAD-dependent oxidoreductase [Clostridia bacterium]
MKQYLIVGNGVAAARCIEGIRSTDSEGRITVISEEPHPVYCRPLISYYLEGKTDLARMQYRDADFYDWMGCHVVFGKAIHIRKDERLVETSDGALLPYDELCLATGSSPFVPAFKGLETVEHPFSFMTLDDALALEKAIRPDSRVLIIGAGLIGLKCAEGLLSRVSSITIADLADRVLSSILDSTCAGYMQRHLEQHGISFLLGDSVAEFTGNRTVMTSGQLVDFDILVLAVGVRANTALLSEIGGDVHRGILVDNKMQTSLAHIYAAGDCTEGMDLSSGQRKVLAILPNASMQGYVAGVNMAGGTASFEKGIPMNAIGFFGLHAMTAGSYDGELHENRTDHSLKRLYTKDDRLMGFILIGCDERAGIYTALIREQTPLSSIDFPLMMQGATTAAFSTDQRRKKFGGVV